MFLKFFVFFYFNYYCFSIIPALLLSLRFYMSWYDQEDRSPLMSEDSYQAVYGGQFAQDPYEDYKNL